MFRIVAVRYVVKCATDQFNQFWHEVSPATTKSEINKINCILEKF